MADRHGGDPPMTRPANPELPGKILDAAEKIVAAQGHDALNMRRLAGAAGITPTTLYYYFDSKDHILAQIKLRAAKRLNGKLQRLDLIRPGGRAPRAGARARRLRRGTPEALPALYGARAVAARVSPTTSSALFTFRTSRRSARSKRSEQKRNRRDRSP